LSTALHIKEIHSKNEKNLLNADHKKFTNEMFLELMGRNATGCLCVKN